MTECGHPRNIQYLDRAEVKTWYQYPFMSEKWSQKGHNIYTDAVAKVLREWQ